jgi:hypothetical protein
LRVGNKKSWVLKPQDQWVYTHVEPVISEELWDRGQMILQELKRISPRSKSEEKDSQKDVPLQGEASTLNGSEVKQTTDHRHFRDSSPRSA